MASDNVYHRPRIDFDLRGPGGLARLFARNKAEFGGWHMSTPGPESSTGQGGGAAGQQAPSGAPEGGQGADAPDDGSEGQEDGTEGQDGPKGGKEALKRDLAREREKRHEAENQFEQFKTALLSALGVKTQADEMTPEALLGKLNEFQQKQDERDQKAAERVKRAAISSAASEMQFHNPADAVSRMDLAKVKIGSDETPDAAYIKSELERIAKDAPYLVKTGNMGGQDTGLGSVGNGDSPAKGKARLEQVYNSKK